MVDASDLELMQRCRAGDEAAFDALHAAHAGRVTAYLRRSGFGPADADDLGQEVFVRVLRSLETFDPARGSLAQWLGAIARNVARRHWQRRRDAQNFDPELAEEMFPSDDRPGDAPEAREQLELVRQCVAALPPGLARVVRLRYVEGRTTRGVALAMTMPEATVRARLKEALSLLEQGLKARGVVD
jgi:RNA polymerase sigma-70 factor (ECF subfamily)